MLSAFIGEHTYTPTNLGSKRGARGVITNLASYVRPFLPRRRPVNMYVKPGQHACMVPAFIGEHTYTPTNLGPDIHTY